MACKESTMTPCRSGLLVALLLWSLITPCLAGAYLEQAAKITFDENNFVIFEQVDNAVPGSESREQGVRLHITRDGQEKTMGFVGYPGDTVVGYNVDNIQYAGKDHLWVTSRLGPRANAVALLNLTSATTELSYAGGWFAFCPDGKRVAYYEFAGSRSRQTLQVCVNDLMIYPEVKAGMPGFFAGDSNAWYNWHPQGGMKEEADGIHASLPRWRDAGTVTFLVRLLGAEEEEYKRAEGNLEETVENSRYAYYVVSGLQPSEGKPWGVTVKRTTLTPEDTRRLLAIPRAEGRTEKATKMEFADNATTTRTTVTIVQPPPKVAHPGTPRPAAETTSATAPAAPAPAPTPVPNSNVEAVNSLGGTMGGVAFCQGYVCIAQGMQLRVLDVSTTASHATGKRVVGRAVLPGLCSALAASGTLVFVGVPGGVQIADLSHPTAPVLKALCPLPLLDKGVSPYVTSIAVRGTMVCVVGNFGLALIDASDPAAPRLYPLQGGSWPIKKVAFAGPVALAIDDFHGLRVFDISDPKAPRLRATCALPSHALQDIAVVGNRAFVGSGDQGLQAVDISDPFTPKLGPAWPIGFIASIVAAGSVLATAGTSLPWNGSPPTELRLLDISDPTTITVHPLPASAMPYLAAAGTILCVANYQAGVQVFDVANPSAPVERASVVKTVGWPGHIAASGKFAYLVDKNTLKVLDLSNPAEPVVRGEISASSVDTMAASGSMVYAVSHGKNCLWVIDVSKADAPVLRGTCPLPGYRSSSYLAISGSFVHEADAGGGYRVIDVSDPASPRVRGSLPQQKPYAIAATGSSVYLYTGDKLTCLDVSDPDAPVVAGATKLGPQGINRIHAVATRLYATTRNGLEIYDVAHPTAPVLLGKLDQQGIGSFYSLELAGDLAYVSTQSPGGLRVVDVSNAEKPRLVGAFGGGPSYGEPPGFAVAGGHAYLALGETGLIVLKYVGK